MAPHLHDFLVKLSPQSPTGGFHGCFQFLFYLTLNIWYFVYLLFLKYRSSFSFGDSRSVFLLETYVSLQRFPSPPSVGAQPVECVLGLVFSHCAVVLGACHVFALLQFCSRRANTLKLVSLDLCILLGSAHLCLAVLGGHQTQQLLICSISEKGRHCAPSYLCQQLENQLLILSLTSISNLYPPYFINTSQILNFSPFPLPVFQFSSNHLRGLLFPEAASVSQSCPSPLSFSIS